MPGDAPEAGRLRAARDGLVVVGAWTIAVTVAGLGWSALRVGAVSATYVREAQFLSGLVALLVWTLRNWRGHPPATNDGAGSGDATPPRPGVSQRLPWGRGGAAVVPTDATLLALGAVLLALSLGGEVLAAG